MNEQTKREIGEYIVEQILLDVAKKRSPVYGDAFQPLTSVPYKEKKRDEGLSAVADLQLSGDMLDSLDYRITDEGIEVGVYGSAAPRADGHNNLSGASQIPTRRFIPDVGESFRTGIMREIERIVADSTELTEDIIEDSLEGVTNSSELYTRVGALLNLESRSEIRNAILRNPLIFNMLGLLGLDEFI